MRTQTVIIIITSSVIENDPVLSAHARSALEQAQHAHGFVIFKKELFLKGHKSVSTLHFCKAKKNHPRARDGSLRFSSCLERPQADVKSAL